MPQKKFFVLAEEKYRKSYIKEKKNKTVLFIYDTQNKPGKKDYTDLPNCFGVDFSSIRNDDNMKDNKEKIKEQLDKLEKEVKKFKDAVVPDLEPLGVRLARKAPQTFKVLMHKLKKYDISSSVETKKLQEQAKKKKTKKNKYNNEEDEFNNTNFGMFNTFGKNKKNSLSKKKGKKSKKQLEKEDRKARKEISSELKEAHAYSSECLSSHNLAKRKLFTRRSSSSKNYVEALESGLASCKTSMSKCKSINQNMKKVLGEARKEKLEAKFPKSCRIDHEGKSKVSRIKEELESTLISQIKILNM